MKGGCMRKGEGFVGAQETVREMSIPVKELEQCDEPTDNCSFQNVKVNPLSHLVQEAPEPPTPP